MKWIGISLACFLITGCVSISEVIRVDRDTYRVSSGMSGNFPSWPEVKGLALKRANEYCGEHDKYMQEVSWETHGARGWTPLNAELTFRCLDE